MRTSSAMLLLIGLGVAGLFLPACVNVEAPKEIKVDAGPRRDRHDKPHRHDEDDDREERIGKDDAYGIAKRLARDAGADPRDYDIHDKEIDGVYWVLFEHDRPRRGLRWRNAFCVRVDRRGRAKLYEGQPRGRVELRRGEDKLSKDDAYDVAYRIAREMGVSRRDYDVHDKGIDDDRWVLFEHKYPRHGGGWKNAFAIRVGKNGNLSVYAE